MTQDDVLRVVAARIDHPDYLAKLDVDATFRDVGLSEVDGWAIAVDLEDEINRELDWGRVEHWQTVRDVVETVEALAA